MIIYKNNKTYETRSDKPKENWTSNSDVYVVDDNSELANKIKEQAPYFDFILGENGELIDIVPTERPEQPLPPQLPTAEERLQALEEAMLMITLGGI